MAGYLIDKKWRGHMYKKVLVPLDGSDLAECTLYHVKNLQKDGSVADIILFRVVEMEFSSAFLTSGGMDGVENFDFQAIWEEQIDSAQKYLSDVQSRLSAEGIRAEVVLIKGARSAHAIIEYAQKNSIDLIAMATHGHTGMVTLLLGSVAFRVLHESHVPVLLIRPESCRK
jgi:nucleotide-binding universal stress UspA family protein